MTSVAFNGTWWDGSLEANLAVMYNFSQQAVLLFPEVSYKIISELKGTVRFIYIDGPRDTAIGQYKDNDQFQILFRYTF